MNSSSWPDSWQHYDRVDGLVLSKIVILLNILCYLSINLQFFLEWFLGESVVPKIPFCFRIKLTATASANTSITVTIVRHTSIDRYKIKHYKVKDAVKGYSLWLLVMNVHQNIKVDNILCHSTGNTRIVAKVFLHDCLPWYRISIKIKRYT